MRRCCNAVDLDTFNRASKFLLGAQNFLGRARVCEIVVRISCTFLNISIRLNIIPIYIQFWVFAKILRKYHGLDMSIAENIYFICTLLSINLKIKGE